MGFAVMHLNKSSSSSSGSLGNHIDRKFVPKNADADLQHRNRFLDTSNYSFTNQPPKFSLSQRIKKRIADGYTKPAKIRKNAVRSINFILTGTHEDMKEIFKNPSLKNDWLKRNIDFLHEEFGGKENIVSFALHDDERTPHIHATIVPITADGRLSARDYVNGRKRLQQLQDIYAEKMKDFDLQRGIADGKVQHMTTAEFYKELNSTAEMGANLTPKQKIKLADNLLADYQKKRLEAKKTPKFDKKYRKKL